MGENPAQKLIFPSWRVSPRRWNLAECLLLLCLANFHARWSGPARQKALETPRQFQLRPLYPFAVCLEKNCQKMSYSTSRTKLTTPTTREKAPAWTPRQYARICRRNSKKSSHQAGQSRSSTKTSRFPFPPIPRFCLSIPIALVKKVQLGPWSNSLQATKALPRNQLI